MIRVITYILFFIILQANIVKAQLKVGADLTNEYLPLIEGRKVAVVVNHTSYVGQVHLVDTLLSLNVDLKKIFSPEHGFRGNAPNGAKIADSKYENDKVAIISLYGKKKKPGKDDLKGIDIIMFDIQDVGTRFYTYISTMSLVMEAAAENKIPMIILDRPNPNRHYIDGPVMEKEFKSFVGLHPVPIVYGMTIGEYAKMVNGEGWLKNGITCELTVIKIQEYDHNYLYQLPIFPSPNLQTMEAIYLYPSLCLFEGTVVSVGRGTDHPFEIIGRPGFMEGNYKFTPRSIPGVSENPKYKGIECNGFNLKKFCRTYVITYRELYLYWLKGFYDSSKGKNNYFTNYFDKLAGTDKLRKQIINGETIENIRKSWQKDLNEFKKIREKYLLYTDFESF